VLLRQRVGGRRTTCAEPAAYRTAPQVARGVLLDPGARARPRRRTPQAGIPAAASEPLAPAVLMVARLAWANALTPAGGPLAVTGRRAEVQQWLAPGATQHDRQKRFSIMSAVESQSTATPD
jgi:hypothetical protein